MFFFVEFCQAKNIVRKRFQNVASFQGFVQFAEIWKFDHVSIFLTWMFIKFIIRKLDLLEE